MDRNLHAFNLAKVVVVDVTDDYRFMRQPLPNEWYPVLREVWVPTIGLDARLTQLPLVDGYLYDWHQGPDDTGDPWYVGVVDEGLLAG
ncbi:MAG: hypothetical protein KIT11_07210 [Fimbriimonadaceae bacterium]|nr:hypothetical protein [Fimbriimonadaceae bacterium]QYK56140.1 MAG: hypothetical protein KF733_01400 [Fimbriimonadaceae bacterium]